MKTPARLPCRFQLGEFVYHRAGESPRGMVTDIRFTMAGSAIYTVAWGFDRHKEHYEAELTYERTFDGHHGGVAESD